MGAFGNWISGSAGAGAAGSIGSALVGGLIGLGGQKLQTKQEKELMKYQFDLQKEMFDYTSEYNSPAKQMERLQAAGLNPNLVYGNGSTVNTQQPVGSVGKGNSSNPFSGLGAAFIQVMSNLFRSAQIDADTRNKQASADLAKSQAAYYRVLQAKGLVEKSGVEWDNYIKSIEAGYLPEYLRGRNNLQWSNYRKVSTEIGLLVDKSQEIQANISLIKARTGLTEQQAVTEMAKRVVMSKQVSLMSSQIGLNNKQVEKLAADIIRIGAEIPGIDLKNAYQELLNKWSQYGFGKGELAGLAQTIMFNLERGGDWIISLFE